MMACPNRTHFAHGSTVAVFGLALVISPLAAQDSSAVHLRPAGSPIRWWHAAAAGGTIAVASLLDETLQRSFQRHRTSGKDDIARVFRRMGQPEVFATVGLGVLVTGAIAGNRGVTKSGGRIATALLVAGAAVAGGKFIVGRKRPDETTDAYQFHPFSGEDAFPSGHATMAFALAASLADEIHRPWATVALYTAAAGTGWSRMNDDKHWLSDALAGAAAGIVSAKLANGRWRLFNIRPPGFLFGPEGPALGWQARF